MNDCNELPKLELSGAGLKCDYVFSKYYLTIQKYYLTILDVS